MRVRRATGRQLSVCVSRQALRRIGRFMALAPGLVAAVLTGTICCAPSVAGDDQPKVLKGQVEHHESLPPLDSGMQSGAQFAESSIQRRAKYASKWFQIPAWFAGSFQTKDTYIESAFDYATGKLVQLKQVVPSSGSELRGHQVDAKGGIWHFYVESGSSKSEQPDVITYNTIDWYGPEVVSESRVVLRIQATSLVVDKNTGTVVDSYQREDIKTYVPKDRDTIAVHYTSKSFDSRGLPRDMQTGRSVHHRVAPFVSIDNGGGVDFKTLFHDYLTSKQLAQLIPR